MFTKKLLALFAAIFVLANTASAQTEDSKHCLDQRVALRSAVFQPGPAVGCGANAAISIGGVEYRTEPMRCPLFIEYLPTHYITEYSPGCGTYTEPLGTWNVWLFTYRCTPHWLLGFIPIDIDSTCDQTDARITSTGSNYSQYPCEH